MIRYSIRRLLLLLITLWLLTVLMFVLHHLFPGDTLTNMSGIRQSDGVAYQQAQQHYAMPQSWLSQYWQFFLHLLHGDWGQSLVTQRGVFADIMPQLGATLELTIMAMTLSLVIGVPMGMYAAVQQRGPLDRVIMGVSLSAYSIPAFWLAQLALLLFAVKLGWAPISGQLNPLFNITPVTGSVIIDILLSDSPYRGAALKDALQHLWLPVLVLSSIPLTMLIRITRNATLDVLQQNYLRAARSRGLSESRIMVKHVMPNAMQVIVRQLGLQFSLLMSNIIIIETIFNWPGIGSSLIKSIYERDYPVMLGGLFTLAALILLVNVAVELYHAWRYPQVRKELYAER
ncbi:ABC transporter permease [Pseudidiomarina mangrovi]|uniref:ABC transporter permease n=1 Tax=Pseudidiomarina mangrovi TaxID=2487133 RepID=UPI000FC9D9CB|nr:ABC transporter permease [Pseudidiomarina mangrovi]